jgi:hypothetical protein
VTQISNATAAVRSAGLAELVWRPGGGAPPRAIGVVPLLLGDVPVVALPWAFEAEARAAATAADAALVLSEPRLAGPAWTPLAVHARVRLVEDGDGGLFVESLLDQELRKHPPARALMDSFLLRRENWWYLPRLVLLLEPRQAVPVARRDGPDDVVLAVDAGADLRVATVGVQDWAADRLRLRPSPAVAGPAVLVGQEVSVPDAERWTVHVTTGHHDHGTFTVQERAATRDLEPVPGLRTRIRRHRELERACARALRAAGHG